MPIENITIDFIAKPYYLPYLPYLPYNSLISQIFLLTGENHFRLREERSRWMRGFREKHGDENLNRADGKGLKFSQLLDLIAAAPFIASKRLVVIEGVPKCEKEDMRRIPEVIHPDVILLFIDASPDKRLSSVKVLMEMATVEHCAPVKGSALYKWMDAFLAERNSRMEPRARDALTEIVGEDQDALASELEKLSLYAVDRVISVADVQEMAVPAGEQSGWALLDLLVAGRTEKALALARRLQERGESPHSLWGMLLWGVAGLPQVVAAVEDGHRNPASIAKEMGIKFNAARTMLPLATTLDRSRIREIINRFAEADIALKTGGYKATAEAPQELEAVLDRCMIELAQ